MTNGFEYPPGATPLDPDEIEGLRFPHVTTSSQLNHLEQANILEGLRWLARQQQIDVLTEEFALDLHSQLFGQTWEWAGRYRRTEKNIGVDPMQIGVELRKLLDDTRYWIDNQVFAPQEIAARFHHRLLQIHLFPNGNGRHARIMADALLEREMMTDPIDWAGGHDLQSMNTRREEYISALRAADRGEYDELLQFIGQDAGNP